MHTFRISLGMPICERICLEKIARGKGRTVRLRNVFSDVDGLRFEALSIDSNQGSLICEAVPVVMPDGAEIFRLSVKEAEEARQEAQGECVWSNVEQDLQIFLGWHEYTLSVAWAGQLTKLQVFTLDTLLLMEHERQLFIQVHRLPTWLFGSSNAGEIADFLSTLHSLDLLS